MSTALQSLEQAVSLIDRGQLDAAEALGRQVLIDEPHNSRALHVVGLVARRSGRTAEALSLLGQAADHSRGNAGVHCELGFALLDAQRPADAANHFRRATELAPDYGDAWLNLGAALDRLGLHEEALAPCRRAAELMPDNKLAHFNLGNVLRSVRQLDLASHAFQKAIEVDPQFASAHWNNACARLLAGDFAAGWAEYEWRERAGEVAIDTYPQPRWQGEALAGRTILVHAEQGIGDEILFASCVPDVIERCSQCALVCEPRLEKLFARSFPRARVHGLARRKDRRGATLPYTIDYQIPAGSLPLHFRASREAFPRRQSFLQADPDRVIHWRRRLESLGDGLLIGVSWRAGGQPLERQKRSMNLLDWRSLLTIPGARFVNLQYGDCGAELTEARDQLDVSIFDTADGDPLVDMDEFAAKVSALDLVITVGNATAHLAGALSVPTWTMLPYVPGWRWMIAGRQSVWYSSVELFRQPARGDWSSVINEVAGSLSERVGGPALAVPKPVDKSRSIASPLSPLEQAIPARIDADVECDRANAAHARKDLAAAESICRKLLDHFPRHTPALALLGQMALGAGRFGESIRWLQQASAAGGPNAAIERTLADAYFAQGRALRDAGQIHQAVVAFEEAVRLAPTHHKALNFLGGCLLSQSKPAVAETALRAAVSLQATYAAAWNNLGLALQAQQRFKEALGCFDRAIELDPTCRPAVGNLATVLEQLGQPVVASLVRRQLQ